MEREAQEEAEEEAEREVEKEPTWLMPAACVKFTAGAEYSGFHCEAGTVRREPPAAATSAPLDVFSVTSHNMERTTAGMQPCRGVIHVQLHAHVPAVLSHAL